MRWVRWRPGVGGGAWFSLKASNSLFSYLSSFFLSGTPACSEICSGVGGIDRGLPPAGEKSAVVRAPAPNGELWKSPRLGVRTLFLCSPCLESALTFVLSRDSLSEGTLDEDEEDEDEWLLVPDEREFRLLRAFVLRFSLRFLRSISLW